MGVIADLPQGEVILPGLDLAMDADAWQAVSRNTSAIYDEKLVGVRSVARDEVKLWGGAKAARSHRLTLMRGAMRPAEVTESWQNLSPSTLPKEAFTGLERIDCDHHREEADVIALRLRAALEDEGRNSRTCHAGSCACCARSRCARSLGDRGGRFGWHGIECLAGGEFFLDVLRAAAPQASPVDFLALLKHPLATTGHDPATCRAMARSVEVKVWRGVRLVGGGCGAASCGASRCTGLERVARRDRYAF